MRLQSLTVRLLIATSLILVTFLGLSAYALDKAFRSAALSGVEERLQNHVFTLIAVAEIDTRGGVFIPQVMPVSRYFQIDDGLYARIVHHDGEVIWQSVSFASLNLPPVEPVPETLSRFQETTDLNGKGLFIYDFGVSWDQGRNKEYYTISIIESLDEYKKNNKRFRKELGTWFTAIIALLLLTLTLLLRWTLSPLRNAAMEIKQIEVGEKTHLEGNYPTELRGMTDNINALIQSNRVRLERYRNSSADLAHSLKTPLAMLQGAAESEQDIKKLSKVCIEQVNSLSQIVSYQLQRAATTGQAPLSKPEPVAKSINKIVNSLNKVYKDKSLDVKLDIDPESVFYGDISDFLELIGNLFDNAYKWADGQIHIAANNITTAEGKCRLTLKIEDDGPGLDPVLAARVMERGVRTDGQGGGTGIGLAVVSDIVNAYDGKLEVSSSLLGGAKFVVIF
ncbi:MAG: ATP-binding protein [Gammaproteobacteria bacterium]|nr:ATP-binding protein [Gammaproteobacteria bacterium]